MIDRQRAWELLQQHVEAGNLRMHCLATEAIMRSLAARLGKDQELWGLTGLLHDVDLEMTRGDQSQHAVRGAELLAQEGFPAEAVQAVRAHNGEVLGIARQSEFDHALACAETITGLIVATALVQPEKKLANVQPKSVKKRMKEKRFAENVNRAIIMECEHLGLSLEDFIALSVEAMQGRAAELGL